MKKNHQISLNGVWNLTNKNNTIKTKINIPGTISEPLIDNNLIPNPFYGDNEKQIFEKYTEDWIFEKNFDIEEQYLKYTNIVLEFDGIDTFSRIELNNVTIGTTENMFRRYEFDISNLAKPENNILKIYIKSPVETAKTYVNDYKVELNNFGAILGVAYLRKAQYSFGWDWGPLLPDIGIWKSVNILLFDDIRIDSYYIDTNFKYNIDYTKIVNATEFTTLAVESANVLIYIDLKTTSKFLFSSQLKLRCKLISPDKTVYDKLVEITNNNIIINFQLDYPYLWWTHDLGVPNLYILEIYLKQEENVIDFRKEKIGIRDIQLIRNADKWGESFYFQLNGIPIFAKGANWIPIDSFIPRGKREGLIPKNIENALKANMNMIRVWGGGVYEDDEFYEICDEKGILVWQDFPFACSIYPIYEDFTQNVKKEAIFNIKRLRNHPSLALWCGNNEIEQLWKLLLNVSKITEEEQIKLYEKGYLTLFKDVLPEVVYKYDPRHQYWPSSSLDKFDGSKVLSINPNNPESGDSHYWFVWHGGAPFKSYRSFDSRFMSEFGFESFPSMKSIKAFCPPNQFSFDSPIMLTHQKSKGGNKKILKYIKRRFKLTKKFEGQVTLSQITQAEAIEYGVEHWRRNRNNYHCMGTIYWQLNDCWPVISWSSFDYYGRWKALHYFAKRFYNPLFPSVKEEKDAVEFWITNDLRISKSIQLFWKLFNSNSELIQDGLINYEIPPLTSKKLKEINVTDINSTPLKMRNNIIFYKCKEQNEKDFFFHGMKLFDSPKYFDLSNPEISWDILLIKNPIDPEFFVQIELHCNKIALYVHIDSNLYDFIASDNFFSMEPDETRIISLRNLKINNEPINNLKNLKKSDFYVKSLYDLRNFK